MIRLSEPQWQPLHHRLSQEYQHTPSVMLIRSRMRATLGFTVRHQGRPGYTPECIYLDFYDDALETWFKLKYSEFLP
jgi:hypothetical protein